MGTGKFSNGSLLINISSSAKTSQYKAYLWGYIEGFMTGDLINDTYADVIKAFGLSNTSIRSLRKEAMQFKKEHQTSLLHSFLNGVSEATGVLYEKLYVLNMYNEMYTIMDKEAYASGRELLVRNFGVVQLINSTLGIEHSGTGYFAVGQHQIAVTVVVFL